MVEFVTCMFAWVPQASSLGHWTTTTMQTTAWSPWVTDGCPWRVTQEAHETEALNGGITRSGSYEMIHSSFCQWYETVPEPCPYSPPNVLHYSQKEWDAMMVLAEMPCFVDPPSPSLPPLVPHQYECCEAKVPFHTRPAVGDEPNPNAKLSTPQRTFKLWRPWEEERTLYSAPFRGDEVADVARGSLATPGESSPSSSVLVTSHHAHGEGDDERANSSKPRPRPNKPQSAPRHVAVFVECTPCDKKLPTRKSLHCHQRSLRSKVSSGYGCPVCFKTFLQKSSVTTHMRIHTGERPFVCNHCSKAFGDFSTYTKHLRVHSGDKPYVCPQCRRGFSQSGNLLRHIRRHTEAAPPSSATTTAAAVVSVSGFKTL